MATKKKVTKKATKKPVRPNAALVAMMSARLAELEDELDALRYGRDDREDDLQEAIDSLSDAIGNLEMLSEQ